MECSFTAGMMQRACPLLRLVPQKCDFHVSFELQSPCRERCLGSRWVWSVVL